MEKFGKQPQIDEVLPKCCNRSQHYNDCSLHPPPANNTPQAPTRHMNHESNRTDGYDKKKTETYLFSRRICHLFGDAVNRTVSQVTREEFGDFLDPNSGLLKAKNVKVLLLCLLLLLWIKVKSGLVGTPSTSGCLTIASRSYLTLLSPPQNTSCTAFIIPLLG